MQLLQSATFRFSKIFRGLYYWTPHCGSTPMDVQYLHAVSERQRSHWFYFTKWPLEATGDADKIAEDIERRGMGKGFSYESIKGFGQRCELTRYRHGRKRLLVYIYGLQHASVSIVYSAIHVFSLPKKTRICIFQKSDILKSGRSCCPICSRTGYNIGDIEWFNEWLMETVTTKMRGNDISTRWPGSKILFYLFLVDKPI